MSTSDHEVAPAGSPSAASRSPLRAFLPAMIAVLLAWTWYVHFWPQFRAANETIRLYFVEAVIETGRPELDPVTTRRGEVPVDRSEYGGHIYMDKAPGLSFLALPLYPLLRDVVPDMATEGIWLFGVIACLLTVTLPAWLMLWLLVLYALSLGVSPRTAMLSVVALALASPMFPYATLYFGHGLAATCAGAAAYLIATPAVGLGSLRRRVAAGALLGYAGLTDTPVFVLSGLIALWAFLRAVPLAEGLALSARLRVTWPLFALLGAGVLAQLVFNAWMLGDPLRFAYHHKGDRALAHIHTNGFFGFHPPDPEIVWNLTFGPTRGLFYHAPWIAVAWVGYAMTARRTDVSAARRLDAAALLAISIAYVLVISGFSDWQAGDSAYARHLVPVLPLAAPGIALALDPDHLPRPVRAIILTTLAIGLLLTIPTVATLPYHFTRLSRPVLELGWPLWLLGNFSPSVGRLLGWSDWWSSAWFAVLCVLPWLLTLRLAPTLGDRVPEPTRARVAVWTVSLLSTLLWGIVLVAAVPPPGRAVQVSRMQASMLLGPDADERDGNKEWQKIFRRAQERNRARAAGEVPKE